MLGLKFSLSYMRAFLITAAIWGLELVGWWVVVESSFPTALWLVLSTELPSKIISIGKCNSSTLTLTNSLKATTWLKYHSLLKPKSKNYKFVSFFTSLGTWLIKFRDKFTSCKCSKKQTATKSLNSLFDKFSLISEQYWDAKFFGIVVILWLE